MYYFVHRCGSLQPRDHVGKDTQERFCSLTWPTKKLCMQEGTIIYLHLEANITAITINAPPSNFPCRCVRANGREYRLHAKDHVQLACQRLPLSMLLQQVDDGAGSHGAVYQKRPYHWGGVPSQPQRYQRFRPLVESKGRRNVGCGCCETGIILGSGMSRGPH
jgi:hypothetical protein